MSNQLQIIEQAIQNPKVSNDLMLALNLQPGDEEAVNTAKAYTSSVLMEVQRSAGTGNYTDLTMARPDTIVRAMIDAAKFKLQIDGRKLCYLEKRGNSVSLQISTNGFVAKIKEAYPDAVFVITPVFKGDKPPSIKQHEDGNKTCEFTSTNVFGDAANLSGILVQISYTDHNGRQVQDVQAVPIGDLKKMQQQSKSKAWGTYTIERMKTAALKRATKWHFRQNATLQAVIDYDNNANYDLSQPATPVRDSIVDNINASTAPNKTEPAQEAQPERKQAEPVQEAAQQQDNGVIDGDFEQVEEQTPDPAVEQQLISGGEAAAAKGWADYKAWITTLSESDRDIVRSRHAGWQDKARAATLAAQEQAAPPPQDDLPPIEHEPQQQHDNDAPPI